MDCLTFYGQYDRGFYVPWRKWHRDHNRAVFADDLSHLAPLQLKARVDQAKASIAEVKDGTRGKLYIANGGCIDASGNCDWSITINGPAEIDGIATYIHQ